MQKRKRERERERERERMIDRETERQRTERIQLQSLLSIDGFLQNLCKKRGERERE